MKRQTLNRSFTDLVNEIKNPLKVSDVAPINWWQDDVLQQNGETKLLHIVEHVKDMCKKHFK